MKKEYKDILFDISINFATITYITIMLLLLFEKEIMKIINKWRVRK